MTHNRNFGKNFDGRRNYTIRRIPDFPPPPLPPPVLPHMRPPYFPPQLIHPQPTFTPVRSENVEKIDQDFIKNLESRIPVEAKKFKPNAKSIIQIREEIQSILNTLKDFECKLSCLRDNINNLPEDEWKNGIDEMNNKRKEITHKLEEFVGTYMDMSRRLLGKRTAKRLRLKRQREERKIAKKEYMEQMKAKSRKIDESLQKIKDDIIKAQKAEEAKLEADVVLKEVRRKKLDANKSLVKLDALLKLRKARQNTATGRGETVSEQDATSFVYNVEKLKTLWNQKLLLYQAEEEDLRAKLTEDSKNSNSCSETSQMGLEAGLAKWRELLFGDADATPQVDFCGDIHRFIAVRSQWDQYINVEGTPLPVGWVVPPLET